MRPGPGFILLGQGKAGTSLIYRTLRNDPDFVTSSRKELHYFSLNFGRGRDWYLSHFPPDPGPRIVAEVSPSYLSPRAVRRIADMLGREIRLGFVLRRPLEQCWSRYVQDLCAHQDTTGLLTRLDRLKTRLQQIEDTVELCYELFGPDRVLPLFFERDIATPEPGFANKLRGFLGLPGRRLPPVQVVNPGVMPWYAAVERDTRLTLGAQRYLLPAGQLAFCAQPRNSCIIRTPAPGQIAAARMRQQTWHRALSATLYAQHLTETVLPQAERLRVRFGWDMSHWLTAPTRLSSPPAPLPAEYLSNA